MENQRDEYFEQCFESLTVFAFESIEIEEYVRLRFVVIQKEPEYDKRFWGVYLKVVQRRAAKEKSKAC